MYQCYLRTVVVSFPKLTIKPKLGKGWRVLSVNLSNIFLYFLPLTAGCPMKTSLKLVL